MSKLDLNTLRETVEFHGDLQVIKLGNAQTHRFEGLDPENPVVLMLSMVHTQSELESKTTVSKFKNVRIKIIMEYEPDQREYETEIP